MFVAVCESFCNSRPLHPLPPPPTTTITRITITTSRHLRARKWRQTYLSPTMSNIKAYLGLTYDVKRVKNEPKIHIHFALSTHTSTKLLTSRTT